MNAAAANTKRATVLLRHTLPGGAAHIDWMIARDARGERPLITFRVAQRIDELKPGETLEAERIHDHRPMYLTYEGPISGDRGCVERIAQGVIESSCDFDAEIILQLSVRWVDHATAQHLSAERMHADRWRITISPPLRL